MRLSLNTIQLLAALGDTKAQAILPWAQPEDHMHAEGGQVWAPDAAWRALDGNATLSPSWAVGGGTEPQ